jgi:hypothetical protein
MGVQRLTAGIASVSALYLTNGAVLPGIWTLIPLIMGIICMMLGFFFFITHNVKMMIFLVFLTLLFYPPLFPFYTIAFFVYLLTEKEYSFKEKRKYITVYLVFSASVAVLISLSYFFRDGGWNNFFKYIVFSKIFYETFTKNAIPEYKIWVIVPVPVLVFSAIGIFSLRKKLMWLVSLIVLGLAYWILYSFVLFRIIIEYQRVIVFTSILLVIAAGRGMSVLIKPFKENYLLDYMQAALLFLFFVFSPRYTEREAWMKMKLIHTESRKVFQSAAPANRYLHPDDLRIFRDMKGKRFLSYPWKGTVIGVATDNFPLSMKPGTISIDQHMFYNFMNADPQEKGWIAKKYGIDYIYSPRFKSPSFRIVKESEEGLYLYRFTGKK